MSWTRRKTRHKEQAEKERWKDKINEMYREGYGERMCESKRGKVKREAA